MARVSRRGLLIGGGAGVGLVVAWNLWPRAYPANLAVGPGEHAFGAWLKVGEDGRVTVAVPQAEGGQGVYTALPQIVADELGADWRQMGVEAAPVNPLYGNPLGAAELFEGALEHVPERFRAPMLTAVSTSVRRFEEPARAAAATARALLQQAAARRWDVDASECGVDRGFVTHDAKRLRFAELAAEAAGGDAPDPPPVGQGKGAGRLMGESVPRIDAPSKVDGSAQFAGDIRLSDMVHARLRSGPLGDSRLVSVDRAAADRVRGLVQVVETPTYVAAVGVTGWAAERGLDALRPRFETRGELPDDLSIGRALEAALAAEGTRVAGEGDVAAALGGGRKIEATYRAGFGVHASVETASAVAAYRDGRLEVWCQTEAPAHARAAAARGAGVGEGEVVVHPMLIGGGFGARIETDVVEQAAHLAVLLRRPVNLVRTRGEEIARGKHRPPAMARMAASLGAGGLVRGWSAKIAAPVTGRALAQRLVGRAATLGAGERYAVGGAAPPYRIPAWAVDHHEAAIGVETGHLRGGAHGYTCFFTECFIDEIAKAGGQKPVSFRIGMLGGEPRLARCLSTAASLGGWDGGRRGTGQGIACHSFRGSHIAVLAEADRSAGGRPRVTRLVAAADCGAVVNPDLVRQQIEGGLIFGLGLALGASTGFAAGRPTVRGFDRLWLPRLADAPEVTVELIGNGEAPGGASELAVPPVAPAVANALEAVAGMRLRTLPLA